MIEIFFPSLQILNYKIVGACYQIVLEKLDWLAAREKCRSLNAESDLASIHSNQENEFVQGYYYF